MASFCQNPGISTNERSVSSRIPPCRTINPSSRQDFTSKREPLPPPSVPDTASPRHACLANGVRGRGRKSENCERDCPTARKPPSTKATPELDRFSAALSKEFTPFHKTPVVDECRAFPSPSPPLFLAYGKKENAAAKEPLRRYSSQWQ